MSGFLKAALISSFYFNTLAREAKEWMKALDRFLKRIFVIFVLGCFIVLFVNSNAYTLTPVDLCDGDFVLNVRGQNVDLIANKAEFEKLLRAISEKTGVKLNFYGEKKTGNLLTLNFENKPLDVVLKKVLGENYAITYKDSKVENMSSIGIKKRIETAEDVFSRIVQETPNKVISTATFFSHSITPEQLVSKIEGTNLKLKSFRHGNNEYSGGYELQQGEPYNEAVLNYRKMHAEFLKNVGHELSNPAGEADLQIIGADIEGEAIDLQSFRQKNAFVRVIETAEKQPQPNILPEE